MRIDWTPPPPEGTYLRGFLATPYSFEETVARLITLSGQDPTDASDGYKVSIEFAGSFDGQPFTLYDYKEDRQIHIGGTDALNVPALTAVLLGTLDSTTPTPYMAREHYDAGDWHHWPLTT